MSRRVAIYCRPSTEPEKRVASEALHAVAKKEGWTVAHDFADETGQMGANPRGKWERLRSFVEMGKADVVMVPSLPAIGATVSDILGEISWLREQRCDLYVHDVGLNTVSPVDQILFEIVKALKAVDDAAIGGGGLSDTQQRRARSTQPELSRYQLSIIRAAVSSGLSPREVAKSLKLPLATIRAFVKSEGL
jgi:DNA invertase Pin-like site-specific DNA recombinase